MLKRLAGKAMDKNTHILENNRRVLGSGEVAAGGSLRPRSRMNRLRMLLIMLEKLASSYLGLLMLARVFIAVSASLADIAIFHKSGLSCIIGA